MIEDVRASGEAEGPPFGRRPILWIGAHAAVVEAFLVLPVAALLFVLYHHLVATVPFNSDLGFKPLEAYDVLHGNPMLRGWIDQSDTYYLTVLPVYVFAVAIHGLSPTVVNVVSAGYYTLTTLAVAALARAGLPRRDQLLAMLVAFGLVAAPAVSGAGWVENPPEGAAVLIAGPGHTGTVLFVLLALLCLRASHHRARIPLALLAAVLLTVDVASDPMALFAGVLPIALVHGLRLAGRLPEGVMDDGLDLGVAVLAGLLGLALARVLYPAIGYQVLSPAFAFVPLTDILPNIAGAINFWLPMFGAQFLGQPLSLHTGEQLFRLLGYGFTVAACLMVGVQSIRALRRRNRHEQASDPLVLAQTLLAVVVCNLAAVSLSTLGAGGYNGRYLVPAVLAGAALTGRVAPAMLTRFRWRAIAAAISICYIAFLPLSLRYAARALPMYGVSTWLEAHHLDHGLAEYWAATNITVTSGDKVQVRPVMDSDGKIAPQWFVMKLSWYRTTSYANYMVIDSTPGRPTEAIAVASFGTPAYVTQVDGFTIMVWNHNLIPQLGPRPRPPT